MPGKVIPVDEVIAEACSTLSLVTQQERVFMRQWAYTAQRKIGFSNINIKFTDPALELSDWSADKPTDLLRTIDLALYGTDGLEIVHKYKGYGNSNSTLGEVARIHSDIRPDYQKAIAITEDDNYFNVESFTSDGSSDGVTLKVKYYAAMVDANGLPMIPEYAVLAIIMYIRAMWAMRENTNQSQIAMAWQMWKEERASADGKAHTPDLIEGKEIAKTINSMIQKVVIINRQF